MSETIIQLRASEFDEAMEFLNMVFGEHSPHDFARMLPTIYRPTDEHMAHNHAIRVDGRICAIVGMFPIAWQVGGARLRVAGIGGVSVRPDSRRLGYMRALMEHCVGRMKAEGCHVSWLGGQRQRYLYFGYDKCGSGYRFTLNKSNLRHSFIGRPKVRFEPLTTDQPERLARAKALHDAQPVHVERPLADFHRHLVCWYHVPYAAVDGDGDMVGYLVANAAGDAVTELLARDDGAALEMVHAWTADHCQAGATFELHPWARRLAQLLGRYCESVSSTSTGNWQVLDWLAAVDAVMKVRAAGAPMADGEVTLEIEGYGPLCLRAKGGEASASPARGVADLTCDGPTAMRMLFGPLKPGAVRDLPARAAVLESWCPLPLSWARQDGV